LLGCGFKGEVVVRSRDNKVTVCLLAGVVVMIVGVVIDLTIIPFERFTIMHQIMGDFIAGLVAALVALALELRHEEQHYHFAAERAAMIAEINHNVRNAVFPLCLAVQKTGDTEANRLSNEAMSRIEIALRDATVDAFSGKVDYSEKNALEKAA
jgi:hypothetical protein